MTENHPDQRDPLVIEKEAIAWFTRMNGKPSATDRLDFRAWLEASPQNLAAFNEVGALWHGLAPSIHMASNGTDDDLAEPLQKIQRLRASKKRSATGPVAASCLALLVAGCWLWLERPNFLQDLSADFVSARGERRDIRLEDGSRILMDADTAMDVDMSAGQRRVRLLRGTAFFDVARNEETFIVQTENGEIRVLGTQFDVAMRQNGKVTVTLAAGSVEVRAVEQAQNLVIKPGETVDYDVNGIAAAQPIAVEDEMAWHEGRFIFNNARLADVLAQIERYRDGRIVILGSSLAERRVSGNIPLGDTDQALKAVQASVGFQLNGFGKLTVVRD
ncbi:FecR family protein [Neorhizobium sp. DT-125]|uniref:FecR family protein n=1 Tax=Neorhizobium sp. DT-125 TaxID=3396163 RepID=UPI003F1D51AC